MIQIFVCYERWLVAFGTVVVHGARLSLSLARNQRVVVPSKQWELRSSSKASPSCIQFISLIVLILIRGTSTTTCAVHSGELRGGDAVV